MQGFTYRNRYFCVVLNGYWIYCFYHCCFWWMRLYLEGSGRMLRILWCRSSSGRVCVLRVFVQFFVDRYHLRRHFYWSESFVLFSWIQLSLVAAAFAISISLRIWFYWSEIFVLFYWLLLLSVAAAFAGSVRLQRCFGWWFRRNKLFGRRLDGRVCRLRRLW